MARESRVIEEMVVVVDMRIMDGVEAEVERVVDCVGVMIAGTQGVARTEAASAEAMISEDPPRRGRDVRNGVMIMAFLC